jgi:hypothetical protein
MVVYWAYLMAEKWVNLLVATTAVSMVAKPAVQKAVSRVSWKVGCLVER